MTVKVDHEQFSLYPGRFVWPGTVMGKSNPLEAPGVRLVAELARVGWEVPGVDVEIHTYGKGQEITRYVYSVSFDTPRDKLRLTFGNRQRNGAYGLYSAKVENRDEVCFYDDGSGERNPSLVKWAKAWIEELTSRLAKMDSFPGQDWVPSKGDPVIRRLCHVEPIPVPADFPVLYAWADRDDAYRLAGLGDEPDAPKNDYGLSGNGWRLCSLGAKDGLPVDPKMNNGYTYASEDPAVRASQVVYTVKEDSLPVELRLRYLNDVYVVDNSAFRHAREAAFEKAKSEGRDRITDGELDSCVLATARTMVPYAEYEGGFEDPVVIIGRQTLAEEARLMRGPIRVDLVGEGVAAIMTDDLTGTEMSLFQSEKRMIPYCRWAARTGTEAGRLLQVDCRISPDVAEILANNPQPSLESLFAKP